MKFTTFHAFHAFVGVSVLIGNAAGGIIKSSQILDIGAVSDKALSNLPPNLAKRNDKQPPKVSSKDASPESPEQSPGRNSRQRTPSLARQLSREAQNQQPSRAVSPNTFNRGLSMLSDHFTQNSRYLADSIQQNSLAMNIHMGQLRHTDRLAWQEMLQSERTHKAVERDSTRVMTAAIVSRLTGMNGAVPPNMVRGRGAAAQQGGGGVPGQQGHEAPAHAANKPIPEESSQRIMEAMGSRLPSLKRGRDQEQETSSSAKRRKSASPPLREGVGLGAIPQGREATRLQRQQESTATSELGRGTLSPLRQQENIASGGLGSSAFLSVQQQGNLAPSRLTRSPLLPSSQHGNLDLSRWRSISPPPFKQRENDSPQKSESSQRQARADPDWTPQGQTSKTRPKRGALPKQQGKKSA